MFLVAGLLISISAAGMLLMYLQNEFPQATAGHEDFYQFLLNTAAFHGAACVMVTLFLRQHGIQWRVFLGLEQTRWSRAVAIGVLIGLIALPIALGLNLVSAKAIAHWYEEPTQQQTVILLQETTDLKELACFGVAAVVFAPLVEEILFRGILFPFMKKIGPSGLAYMSSALLFAVIHINLVTFVPLFFLGLILAWLLEWTDNLLAPIAAHSVFNLANFLMLILGRELF